MNVSRLSVSLPAEVEAAVRTAAEDAGVSVSAWVAEVAERAAKVQQGRRAVDEFEAEDGRFTEEERRRARSTLKEVGLVESIRSAG